MCPDSRTYPINGRGKEEYLRTDQGFSLDPELSQIFEGRPDLTDQGVTFVHRTSVSGPEIT